MEAEVDTAESLQRHACETVRQLGAALLAASTLAGSATPTPTNTPATYVNANSSSTPTTPSLAPTQRGWFSSIASTFSPNATSNSSQPSIGSTSTSARSSPLTISAPVLSLLPAGLDHAALVGLAASSAQIFDELLALLLNVIVHGIIEPSQCWSFIRSVLNDQVISVSVAPWFEQARVWIRESLIKKRLSHQLKLLHEDDAALNKFYNEKAFLRHNQYLQPLVEVLDLLKDADFTPVEVVPQPLKLPLAKRRNQHIRQLSNGGSAEGLRGLSRNASAVSSTRTLTPQGDDHGGSSGFGPLSNGSTTTISPGAGFTPAPGWSSSGEANRTYSYSITSFDSDFAKRNARSNSGESAVLKNQPSTSPHNSSLTSPTRSQHMPSPTKKYSTTSLFPLAQQHQQQDESIDFEEPRVWIDAHRLMEVSSQIFTSLADRKFTTSSEVEADNAHFDVVDRLIAAVEEMKSSDRLASKAALLESQSQSRSSVVTHTNSPQVVVANHSNNNFSPLKPKRNANPANFRSSFLMRQGIQPIEANVVKEDNENGSLTAPPGSSSPANDGEDPSAESNLTPLDDSLDQSIMADTSASASASQTVGKSPFVSPRKRSLASNSSSTLLPPVVSNEDVFSRRSSRASSIFSAETVDSVPIDPSQWRSVFDKGVTDVAELSGERLSADVVTKLYLRSLTANQLDPPSLRLIISDEDAPQQALLPWPKLNKPKKPEKETATMSGKINAGKDGGVAARSQTQLSAVTTSTTHSHPASVHSAEDAPAAPVVDGSDAGSAILSMLSGDATSHLERDNNSSHSGPEEPHQSRLRGTDDWAPPRRQIVFTIQQRPTSTREGLAKQHFRCAGCGMAVDAVFAKRFRYCEYLGKFFCSSCHSNEVAIIPARILHKWDFSVYPVSKFALEFLNDTFEDPFYDVQGINPKLYERVKPLMEAKSLRLQMFYLKDYLTVCKSGAEVFDRIQTTQYLASDPDLYSMHDLVNVANGTFVEFLKVEQENMRLHVLECELCRAKGFTCEFCHNLDDIYYPFELTKAIQCTGCKWYFHRDCFMPTVCPRCARFRRREERRRFLEMEGAFE